MKLSSPSTVILMSLVMITIPLLLLVITMSTVIVEGKKTPLPSTITASVFMSDISGKRFQKMPDLTFVNNTASSTSSSSSLKASSSSFSLSPTSPNVVTTLPQKLIGIGASLMRSGAMVLNTLSQAKQESLMKDCFDPVDGAHFSAVKLSVGATDFMPPAPFYTYRQEENLKFSIDYDLNNVNGTIPLFKKALAATKGKTNLTVQSTLDYPPQWMLRSDTPLPKAMVNESYYPALAQYFVNFFTEFGKNGVPITHLDLLNEPVESYLNMNQAQTADFIKNHMGPAMDKIRKAEPNRQMPLLSWGAQYGRSISYTEWMDFMINDPQLLKYIDFVAVHGYDSYFRCDKVEESAANGIPKFSYNTSVPNIQQAFDDFQSYIQKLQFAKEQVSPSFNKENPLPAFMTELCYAIEFNNYPKNETPTTGVDLNDVKNDNNNNQNVGQEEPPLPPRQCPKLPRSDFLDSMQWGRMIFGDFNAGASLWLYWNLILDTNGGPWLVSPDHNDPDDNIQQPLVIVDGAKDEYHLTGGYYALAHFSKWVKKGMRKVVDFTRSSDLPQNVHSIAFAGTEIDENDSSKNTTNFVFVLMNDRAQPVEINSIRLFGEQMITNDKLTLPAVSFTTITFQVAGDVDVSLQKINIMNPNPSSKPEDNLADGWQAPVFGTIAALCLVLFITVWFVRTQNQQQAQKKNRLFGADGGSDAAGGGAAAQQEGDYKQMA